MSKPDASMKLTYEELVGKIIKRYDTEFNTLRNQQLFIGIGGGPGSGKSTLSEEIVKMINDKRPDTAVVLPMDGFHYTRAELREMGSSNIIIGDPESNTSSFTSFEDLLARRGSPWTFDAPSIIREFSKVRNNGNGYLPVYSRQISDPVQDGVELKSSHQIVLLEGNYLLCYSDPTWQPLEDIFDWKLYISCMSIEDQRERLIKRHLETWSEEKTKMWGEGRNGAAAKADANDVKNAYWVDEMSRKHADLIIESK